MGTGSFPLVNRPGRGVDHAPASRAEAKERVELYSYSPCGSSWPVLGWTLPLPLTLTSIYVFIYFIFIIYFVIYFIIYLFHLFCYLFCYLFISLFIYLLIYLYMASRPDDGLNLNRYMQCISYCCILINVDSNDLICISFFISFRDSVPITLFSLTTHPPSLSFPSFHTNCFNYDKNKRAIRVPKWM